MANERDYVRRTWERVVGHEVDAETDFFAAGGDSLTATRIVGELSQALGVKVPLRMLFDNQKCADFGAAVERLAEASGSRTVKSAARRLRVAVLGTGNVGTDLLLKIVAAPGLDCLMFSGRRADSPGIKKARELGVNVSTGGVDGILRMAPDIDVVFDATSAGQARAHWAALEACGTPMIDLTPAHLGPFCVPALNLDDCVALPYVSMVTCGGQAAVPLASCICAACSTVPYVEIASTSAAASVGPATRANMDEYVLATEQATREFCGVVDTKTMLIVNPAIPSVKMQNTVAVPLATHVDMEYLVAEVAAMEQRIAAYVPGYKVTVPPTVAADRLLLSVEVEGLGDWLPPYAGNLDIITSAAIAVAEGKARHGL